MRANVALITSHHDPMFLLPKHPVISPREGCEWDINLGYFSPVLSQAHSRELLPRGREAVMKQFVLDMWI